MRLPRNVSGRRLADALRVGTLADIRSDVAEHFSLTRDDLLQELAL